jgi:Phage integrase family
LAHGRRGKRAEPDFRSVFIPVWGDRPVGDLTTADVLAIITAKKRTAPAMAKALLTLVGRFFTWVIDQQVYDLTTSPCSGLTKKKIVGETIPRTRRLNDAELFALWRSAGRMGYPVGAVYWTLLLTALRLNEGAQMSWPEVHGDTVIVAASRMKASNGRAREHLVPLSMMAKEVLTSLPRFKGGQYLFSLSAGKTPVAMSAAFKSDLDRRMLRTLRALARRNGEDYRTVKLEPWTNHDLRRVVRSALSSLRVPHVVAEAILAHRQGGVVAVYDLHEYESEKREALEKWAEKLASIVDPKPTAPATVINLRGRR